MCVDGWVRTPFSSYPEGAVGHIDLPPGDDDGVFDGLDWSVHTQVSAIAFVCHLDVDGAAFRILSRSKSTSAETPADPDNLRQGNAANLGVNGEVALSCHAGVNGEFCWLVHQDTGGFQAGTVGFHLGRHISVTHVTQQPIERMKRSEVTFSGKVSLAAGRM